MRYWDYDFGELEETERMKYQDTVFCDHCGNEVWYEDCHETGRTKEQEYGVFYEFSIDTCSHFEKIQSFKDIIDHFEIAQNNERQWRLRSLQDRYKRKVNGGLLVNIKSKHKEYYLSREKIKNEYENSKKRVKTFNKFLTHFLNGRVRKLKNIYFKYQNSGRIYYESIYNNRRMIVHVCSFCEQKIKIQTDSSKLRERKSKSDDKICNALRLYETNINKDEFIKKYAELINLKRLELKTKHLLKNENYDYTN